MIFNNNIFKRIQFVRSQFMEGTIIKIQQFSIRIYDPKTLERLVYTLYYYFMLLLSKARSLFQFCYAGTHPSVDYYKVLDISPTASTQEIKTRYYELAKKFHPDMSSQKAQNEVQFEQKLNSLNKERLIRQKQQQKQKDDKSFVNLQFIRINQAYEILKDHNKRNQYDRSIGYMRYDNAYAGGVNRDNQQYYQFYQRPERFKNKEQYEQYKWKQRQQQAQRMRKQRISSINGLIVLFAGVSASLYIVLKYLTTPAREYADQHEIRRKNLILSKQNINSGPFAQERRLQQYAKEIADKKIRAQVVTLKVSGGAQESTRAKHKRTFGMEGIPGVQKVGVGNQVDLIQQQQQDYI